MVVVMEGTTTTRQPTKELSTPNKWRRLAANVDTLPAVESIATWFVEG
jgi:hypothetical protein